MSIGSFITKECKKRNMSIKDYANKCGVTPDYIHKLKKDEAISPTIATCRSLAMGLDMSLRDFLEGSGDISSNQEFYIPLEDSKIFLVTINRFLKKININVNNLSDEEILELANYILLIVKKSYVN